MLNKRKGVGYVNIIVSIILAIILSSLTYQSLTKILTTQKKSNIRREYDIVIQNEIIKTYNMKWIELEESQIYIPYNDSVVNVSYDYIKGDKNKGVTDKLTVDFSPEDKRLNKQSYDLEKFPET